ncbi:spore coat protein GerQ [Bacillus solitudinis]|uniref:spore coat protein GerQ n=1 Tax=Bacillus solitudinis TaxID=2014074 RepID=UPI000C2489F0|nr:spore coat protein GerQ [Bacillus solitudinis]
MQQWNPHQFAQQQAGTQQQGYGQQFQQQPQMPQGQLPYFYAPQTQATPSFTPQQQGFPPVGQEPGMLPIEQSYIENILRLNRGKVARVHMTFENNPQWNARVFVGRVEEAGRDHIILSELETGVNYLLLMVNLDFVEFSEPLDYDYPYSPSPQLAQYSPREDS